MPYCILHSEAGVTLVSDSRTVGLGIDNMPLNRNARHRASIQQKSVVIFIVTDCMIVRKTLCPSGSMLPHLQTSHDNNTD